MRRASVQNWVDAVAMAWRYLCKGEDDAIVRSNETWAYALARCAGRILTVNGYGRPPGPAPAVWLKVVASFAERESCSNDGRVQTWDGRKLLEQLPKAPPKPKPIIIPFDDTPRIVFDDGTVLT